MKVTIYTDGSCIGNPGPGGWAAMLRVEINGALREKVISGGEPATTNNQMELRAAIEALNLIRRPCTIFLYTDSAYLANNFSRIPLWRAKGWQTTVGEVKNRDLWELLDGIVRTKGIDLRFQKVAGHAGVADNEAMDTLARMEAMKFKY